MVLLFVGILLVLFMIGMPVSFALGITSVLLLIIEQGSIDINYSMVAQRMLYGPNSFVLLSVPFFLLMGNLMNTGGMTNRIFKFANSMVGHLRGGLGHVNIVASIIFAGMSGTAVSDAAGLGTVEIEAMNKAGYDEDFSCAVTAASSTVGPIIPPSIPLVIYGVLASVSIAKLLIAGIIPGLVLAIAMMIMVAIMAKRRDFPRSSRASLKVFATDFGDAFLPILTPIILIGGIFTGVFTATEAAAVAAIYALVLGCFVYREISLRKLIQILRDTARDTAIITFILACATLYGWVLIRSRIPILFLESMVGLTQNPIVILLILNVALIVVGCFMETIAALNILVPVLAPLIVTVGIDPIQFGIVMVLNLMIGVLTPPFGLVLFVISKVSSVPLGRIIRATAPFFIPLVIVLLLITLVPELVTFLPNLVFGR